VAFVADVVDHQHYLKIVNTFLKLFSESDLIAS